MKKTLLIIVILNILISSCGFEERERNGLQIWEKAKSIDNTQAYYNYIVAERNVYTWDTILYNYQYTQQALEKFIEKNINENSLELSTPKLDSPLDSSIIEDLSFCSYLIELNDAQIILSMSSSLESANYIYKGGGYWQRPKTLFTGGTIKGTFTIVNNETKEKILSQDYAFDKPTPRELP